MELAAMAGLHLDPWQQLVMDDALGEREDGKWSAFEVGVEVARQNGKGGILEARSLAGLFLLGESLIIHSAHEFKTAEEALERMAALIEGCADLSRRVKVIKRSHGQEGVYLMSGQRLRYATRTKGGGRGFTADCVILDEAMVIPEAMHGALLPTLSARPNPQVWYTGSAVDQESMDHGLVFSRLRSRAQAGDDPALAYFGWSAEASSPSKLSEEQASAPDQWALANPGLGIRISLEHVAREQRSMDSRTFAVERLGVGDWPEPESVKGQVLDPERWRALVDPASEIVGRPVFAFDVKPDRSAAAIGVAGDREDGLQHVEVIDHRPGTGWVVERLAQLVADHEPLLVLCDQAGPGMSLVKALEREGVEVRTISAQEHVQACGGFYDAVDQSTVRHLGSPGLRDAVRGAVRRSLGDAWAWSRRSSAVDITPLVSCTLALWGAASAAPAEEFTWEVFS